MGQFSVTRSNPTHQLTDPTQPDPVQVKKLGPNRTQPNTTNNGAYSLVVTYFHTQNLWVSGTGQIGRKTNLTAWCNQLLSNRALSALT